MRRILRMGLLVPVLATVVMALSTTSADAIGAGGGVVTGTVSVAPNVPGALEPGHQTTYNFGTTAIAGALTSVIDHVDDGDIVGDVELGAAACTFTVDAEGESIGIESANQGQGSVFVQLEQANCTASDVNFDEYSTLAADLEFAGCERVNGASNAETLGGVARPNQEDILRGTFIRLTTSVLVALSGCGQVNENVLNLTGPAHDDVYIQVAAEFIPTNVNPTTDAAFAGVFTGQSFRYDDH